MRDYRVQLAKNTLDIQRQGFYYLGNKRISIANLQKSAENSTRILTPEDCENILKRLRITDKQVEAVIDIVNKSTVWSIIKEQQPDTKIAALNFASARNAGGGFIRGSMAQEEALCYADGLYNTQILHPEYYEANLRNRAMTYTNHAIYSPEVPFFRNDKDDLLEVPVTASILTMPAVNIREVKLKGENIEQANKVMKHRMELCLRIFVHEQADTIIV